MPQLSHRNPTNHPTDWWDQVIQAIPKSPDLHGTQRDFLLSLDTAPFCRILDIGSGEGTFTETALTLLLQSGRLAPSVHLDILEAVDDLWTLCEKRLAKFSSYLADQGVEFSFSRIELPKQIPRDQEELIATFDQIQRDFGTYPLIIASHVTYYFHDGGIAFAYAMLTRLLAENGYAWFVVRDRDCPFYRLRKKLLVEKRLPDINTHQFADSFVNSLKILFEGVQTVKRDLFLNLEGLSADACRRVIEYLTWLDGMQESELKQFMHATTTENCVTVHPSLEFAEQHVWIGNHGQITEENEKTRIQAAQILSRCLNSVWEIAPDVSFISVSLAEIAPSGDRNTVDPNRQKAGYIQDDHARPMAFPGFNLVRYGFDGISNRNSDNNLLEQYFSKHTSFLYYPRFYIDHIAVCPATSRETSFHTVMPAGGSGPDLPPVYACRKGEPEAFAIRKPVLTRSTFNHAIDAWAKLTEDYYITEAASGGLWSFAVGTHLLPGGSFSFDDDPNMNSRCALFLTVSTRSDFGRLSGHVVGHIKTILTQYLAQKVYQIAQDRLRETEKAAQIMRLMQRPLSDLALALDAMQRDTQELKSILYEPSEALFRGYSRISHLFEQGRKVELSDSLTVSIQHTPSGYRNTGMLRALLCHIILCCCGKEKEIGTAATFDSYSRNAAQLLEVMEKLSAFDSLIRGIRFLCAIREMKELLTLDASSLSTAVTTFKSALFTPFKLDSRSFPGIALALLFESCPSAIRDIQSDELPILPAWTPLRYSSVLSFLSKVHFEYRHRAGGADCVDSVRFIKDNNGGGVELQMKGRPFFERSSGGHELVRQRIDQLLAVPRDWRIDHANVGDFMASFVTLTVALLGIGETWFPKKVSGNELLRLISAEGSRMFSLQITDDPQKLRTCLKISWLPVKVGD